MIAAVFAHTYAERGSWRGWLRDGQTLEISWPRTSVGIEWVIHSDETSGRRMLWLGLGIIQFFIPWGRVRHEYPVGDEPSWGFSLSREFGIVWHWRHLYKSWRWPFHTALLDRSYMTADGWRTVPDYSVDRMAMSEERNPFWNRPGAAHETHDYTYTLASGEVQRRKATILHERVTLGRNILSHLGWPKRVKHAISVEFSGEVGEETGSWKGGTVACGYNMEPGETPLAALRRMEREREFN